MNDKRNALVTGATSGLGFEAAAQLAAEGYDNITITGRTQSRAAEAATKLREQTGKDVFTTLTVDLSQPESVQAAASELADRGERFDTLLLNAGMVSGNEIVRTIDGIEMTFASSLIGHHQLTMRILESDLLAPMARVVIAGSEAARGDVPMFNPVDLPDFAKTHFSNDLEAAAEALIRQDGPVKFKSANAYANAKLFVAWWAASLARKLPEGTTVNAVSPGSAPDTDAGRNANFMMGLMMKAFKKAPARLGMSAPVSVAATRYIDATKMGADVTGQFFASAPKKMTGPLHKVVLDHVHDRTSQDAAWNATVKVAGGIGYPSKV